MIFTPEKYYVIFSETHYHEFCDLSNVTNDFLLKSVCGKFRKEEGNLYVLETNRTEFCMLIIEFRHIASKHHLIKRLMELGQNQDPNFHEHLAMVERETRRYSLLDH
jgi:hypothetical protein